MSFQANRVNSIGDTEPGQPCRRLAGQSQAAVHWGACHAAPGATAQRHRLQRTKFDVRPGVLHIGGLGLSQPKSCGCSRIHPHPLLSLKDSRRGRTLRFCHSDLLMLAGGWLFLDSRCGVSADNFVLSLAFLFHRATWK